MSARNAVALAVVLGGMLAGAGEGCGGETLTVGSNDGGRIAESGGATADAGFQTALGNGTPAMASDAMAGHDSGALAEAAGPPPTIVITTCNGEPADASATLGVGLSITAPTECAASSGPAHAVASTADVSSLLVGDWSACGGQVFGLGINEGAYGVELQTDGQYRVLGATADSSLAPLDSIPAGSDAGTIDGTWVVVDGSALYGAGTYELQIHPTGGGLFDGQVTLTDSPRQLHYAAPGASPQIYAPAAPWTPRAGVCSCVSEQATKVAENDPVGLAAAMLGRWVWCSTQPLPQGPTPLLPPSLPVGVFEGTGMGIEFVSDGTWYELDADSTGALTRSAGPSQHGTFNLGAGGIPAFLQVFLSEPLTLDLQTSTGNILTQAVVTQNPRTLLLSTVRRADGQDGSLVQNEVFFPTADSAVAVAISECAGGDLTNSFANLGEGSTAFPPTDCTAPSGPAHAVASAADVTSLLGGQWIACDGQVFGMAVDAAHGIQFSDDGTYQLLVETEDGSLVEPDSLPASDAAPGPPLGGTFDVIDGSATYGAGTYGLELHPAEGGLFAGQVVLSDAPPQLHYFEPNANPQVYTHPGPWSPRAGVCSCVSTKGTQVAQSDATALAAGMVGRWVWCGNEPLPSPSAHLPENIPSLFDGPAMGIEFTADGSWYELKEDSTGALSRGTGESDNGTFQVTDAPVLGTAFQVFYSPEPLTLELQATSGIMLTKVVLTQSPRVLLLNTPRQANGEDGTAMENAVLFPLP